MSYDISFRVKVEGVDRYIEVGDCSANITYNVREIIERSTGLHWTNESNNGLCKDIMPKISQGYTELLKNGDKYKKYEPLNGWGTVSGTMYFFSNILCAWADFVYEYPDLTEVATFWIT